MQVKDVQVTKVETNSGNELAEACYRVCVFCDKVVRVTGTNFQSCAKLAGNKFYCPFCIRNNFHYRTSRNVLVMSFRGIIGHYYYSQYNNSYRRMYFTELERLVERHSFVGLQNPVFNYDPHTFLWFLDFNRIGSDRHKAPFEETMETTKKIYEIFDVKTELALYPHNEMWSKFEKAIVAFYEKRKRPKNKRMLIPTFHGILHSEPEDIFDASREFVRSFMIPK
jgi:hypothetical protein